MRQLRVNSRQLTVRKMPCLACLFFILLIVVPCFAQDINFEVTVDRNKVSVGGDTQLNLTFNGTQEVATPYFPGVDGFDWRYLGPSKMTSIINGNVSNSITHRYRLIALRAGRFTIPSFSIQFRGKTYTSEPISIEVVSGPVTQNQSQSGIDSAGITDNLDDRIFLIIEAGKRQAYVNELIPVTIKLYVNNMAVRDIQYPELTHEGFSINEFSQPKQYQQPLRGVLHNVIEFNTHVFATRSGELTLGSAQLECNLLLKDNSARRRSSLFDDFFDDDFFAQYKTYPVIVKSAAVPITILDLPAEGKPVDFKGAVGNYQLSVYAEPREVKVGDPVTLKITVSGEGNFKTVDMPGFKINDDFKAYDPDVKQDSDKKTFEQVIIPKNEKIKEIPEISFSYFDVQQKQYKTIAQGPLAIKVKPLPKGEQMQVFELSKGAEGAFRRKEVLGRDIIYIKDTLGALKPKGVFLCKNKLFILALFIPLLAVIASILFQRQKQRLETDIGYARRLRARGAAKKNLLKVQALLKQNSTNEFFDAVFKTLQEYLGDKFHLATASITSDVIGELRSRGVEEGILQKIGQCFGSCDAARYAVSNISQEDMAGAFELLKEIIAALERLK